VSNLRKKPLLKNYRKRTVDTAVQSHRSQMVWSAVVAVAVATLALYQVFGKSLDDSAASTVTRLEVRAPATIR
jgi:hypothetical protein